MLAPMKRLPWWVWVSLAPLGLGAWAPLVPGIELRRRWWIAWGVVWSVVTVAGWAIAVSSPPDEGDVGGGLIILGWVGAFATTLVIRRRYLAEAGSAFVRGREAAEQRLEERREALELAVREPALAVELGIGRPDLPGAQHAGLVDVNNAPVAALRRLPGVDEALARRILDVRAEVNGFSSVTDLGTVLDLDGNAVERLRGRTVFLPR
jgi:hypothetical protein